MFPDSDQNADFIFQGPGINASLQVPIILKRYCGQGLLEKKCKGRIKGQGPLLSTTLSGIPADLLNDAQSTASVFCLNHIKPDNASRASANT